MDLIIRVALTPHFNLDEFFDKQTYIDHTEQELRDCLDMDFINDLEKLRVNIDSSFTINNWWNKGSRQWSGARNPRSKDYSKGSMHTLIVGSGKKLKAVDIICATGAGYLRSHIKMNYHLYPTFKRLEKGVSWCHVDTLDVGTIGIYEFGKPKKKTI